MSIDDVPVSVWFPYRQPRRKARLRLFCFPYAGGGASLFRPWLEALPSEIAVVPVQLPGRENRLLEPPVTQLSRLVDLLAEALAPYLDLPYACFGHSMGALIGFELIRLFRRKGYPLPVHLFISARSAPQLLDLDPPLHALPDQAFIEELRRLQGTSEEILQCPELLQILLPLLRADFALCQQYAYQPEPPLACSLTAFGGIQDQEISRADLLAWREHTSGSFRLRFFAGDHFFVHTERAALLEAVGRDLLR